MQDIVIYTPKKVPLEDKSILINMPRSMGDVLILTGIFKPLLKKHPNYKIYIMTDEVNFPILKNNPLVSGVFKYRLNKKLIDEHFSIIYNPFIYTQRLPNWWMRNRTLHQIYADACEVKYDKPFLYVEKPDIEIPYKKFATIHTSTHNPSKNYSYFDRVLKNLSIPFIQIGGKKDIKLNNSALDLRGKLSVNETGWIISKAVFHLGIDSFPGHISSAVNTPSFIVFGGTIAKLCLPLNNATAIKPPMDKTCSIACHRARCTEQKIKCIDYIVPEKIASLIKRNFKLHF